MGLPWVASMTQDAWLWELCECIPSETGAGRRILTCVLDRLRENAWLEQEICGVHLALEEAIVNAIRHGNDSDVSKRVTIRCRLAHEKLWVEVTDEGPGFDPDAVPDPRDPENIEIPSGRGLLLIKHFMSRVEYHDRGNRVTMEKVRGTGGCGCP